ncbi:anthranilate synthase component I family protein [Microbacterium sp. NPDC076768]|uniref:anthranilate synthase component I family protein n=1 Tax=Microbacterium sp. NPDC076768 TaxID=3154858 RepID=UPI00344776AC
MPDRLNSRILAVCPDAASVFLMLESRSTEVFWLDAGIDAVEGWSFIGTGTRSTFPHHVALDVAAAESAVPPFCDGWIGWLDYETGAAAAGAPVASSERMDGAWLRATRILAIDHASQQAWAISSADDLEAWAAEVSARTDAPDRAASAASSFDRNEMRRDAVSRHEPAEYIALIEECRELIRAGTAYQLCLTTRFTVEGSHNAADVYLRLRAATPAHHGGFVRIGDRSLLSASPEQFLHASQGTVRTRPIKGTRPRSTDPVEDAALAAELATNSKERAENVMIVDLMRNDLSRVCEPGSIRVEGLWVVESYPAVHQLVSTVSGALAKGVTVGELLAATFPAGSMTGAPKLSAMTRLYEREGGARGIYAGCFGYIGVDGSLDLAMVIRSIVIEPTRAVVGAGGGITWGSVAAAEVAEVTTKARAPLAALGAELPASWGSDILN